MNYKIVTYPQFEKELKRLAKKYKSLKSDFATFLQELRENPNEGAQLGHGLRKVRMSIASKGKGKSAPPSLKTLVNFTSKLSLYYAYNNSTFSLLEIIAKQKILQIISKDLSKPLRRYDSELEYVPTQLICEYCKINSIDGICFNSSLHKGGINIVLFDASSAECIKVENRVIRDVHISI